MTNKLQHYLTVATNIDGLQLDRVVKCFKLKTLKRNSSLLSAGEICREFYFVGSGIIRTYYLTRQGHEKTRHIAFENSFVSSVSSFINQTPSFEFVEVLEDAELYSISFTNFYQLVKEVPGWALFYQNFLEMAYISQNKKIEGRVTLTASERYRKLMVEDQRYIQRVSNKILATYLDITQETLSRLKSK